MTDAAAASTVQNATKQLQPATQDTTGAWRASPASRLAASAFLAEQEHVQSSESRERGPQRFLVQGQRQVPNEQRTIASKVRPIHLGIHLGHRLQVRHCCIRWTLSHYYLGLAGLLLRLSGRLANRFLGVH